MQPLDAWTAVEAIGVWFGGLATAGSFWLGFLILLGDRRRAARKQARHVLIWEEMNITPAMIRGGARPSSKRTRVFKMENNSDRPIFPGGLFFENREWENISWRMGDHVVTAILPPGQMATVQFEWQPGDPPPDMAAFRDYEQNYWVFDLQTYQLGTYFQYSSIRNLRRHKQALREIEERAKQVEVRVSGC